MSAVSKMVQENFDAIFNMISVPFLAVTIPLAVALGWMVIRTFTKHEDATDKLADEVHNLTITIAHLEGAKK